MTISQTIPSDSDSDTGEATGAMAASCKRTRSDAGLPEDDIEMADKNFRAEVAEIVLDIFEIDALRHEVQYMEKLDTILEVLQTALKVEITPETPAGNVTAIEKLCREYFLELIDAPEAREISKQPIYRSFIVAAILLHYPDAQRSGLMWEDSRQLLCVKSYNECFGSATTDELDALLLYRNYMAVAHQIFRLKGHAHEFMDIVNYICEGEKKKPGAKQEVSTGGGLSTRVKRLKLIFDNESSPSSTPVILL